MYLVCIHVPVFEEGPAQFVTTDWGRSLQLLRDSFNGRFGDLCVVAPTKPVPADTAQVLMPVSELGGGLEFVGAFDHLCTRRRYWTVERARWMEAVAERAKRADVIHTGMGDLYRPINFDALRVSVHSRAPIVFVRDTDEVQKAFDLTRNASFVRKLQACVYNSIYSRAMRWAVANADLSLLKGQSLMNRYARFAKHAECFHDTSYDSSDVVPGRALEARLASLQEVRPLSLVYCGRFEGRKGVDHSIRAVAEANRDCNRVTLDLIGGGKGRTQLERLVQDLKADQTVRFLGKLPYNKQLLQQLSAYDGLLFTPLGEDTPRMIFDGYAAGLPLIGYATQYNLERERDEHAAVLVPLRDWKAVANLIRKLSVDRERLALLTHAARNAGIYHGADNWYARRAQWTFEMIDRHRSARNVQFA